MTTMADQSNARRDELIQAQKDYQPWKVREIVNEKKMRSRRDD